MTAGHQFKNMLLSKSEQERLHPAMARHREMLMETALTETNHPLADGGVSVDIQCTAMFLIALTDNYCRENGFVAPQKPKPEAKPKRR